MASDSFAHLQGTAMDRPAIDSFLAEHGVGLLSLTDGAEAYAIPVSYGYDGAKTLYFVFLRLGEHSKKERFARQTNCASLTVYEAPSKHTWRSVIASGPIAEIDDDEWPTLRDAIAETAWYPSLFSEAAPMRDLTGWRLDIETVTGQESTG
jgi:hypothetical protein